MARYCTSCGTPVESGQQFCTNCGQPVGGLPSAAPGASAPYPGRVRRGANSRLILVVIVVVVIAIGGAAAYFLAGPGAAGDCVYIFEGTTNRYPDYSEGECDAFCADVRFGGCYWDPYLIMGG